MRAKFLNFRLLIPFIIITFFSLVCYAIIASPEQSHRKAAITIVPSVEVSDTIAANHKVAISAQGLIIAPNKAISLLPQVSGVIVKAHKNFIPGGFIPAGNSIVEIEQTDFKILLSEAQAKLTLAEVSLTIEQGQQRLAKREFFLNDTLFVDDGENKALALRVPQLHRAQAQVQLAKSAVEKAQISLQRTNLSLPYAVRVLSINAATGELITQQKAVALLTKANERWLELKFPAKNIDRVKARTHKNSGSLVTFSVNNQEYQGEVISLLADLVNSTRMSGAIVEVKDLKPKLAERNNNALLIGAHVSASIMAGNIKNAYAIPRAAFINNKEVFVVDKYQYLRSRKAVLKWHSEDKVIVDIKLEANDKIITSQVFGIALGTKVKPIKQANF